MNSNTFRFGIAAAVVVLAAIVGINFLRGSNVGGPPEPTASPIPTPNPNAYVIQGVETDVVVTVILPAGWMRGGWLVNNRGGTTTDLTAIQIWAVGDSFADPCNWSGTKLDPPLGPTVQDLATALQNQLNRDATTSDVTLDGYSGKLVKMTVPTDAVFADCDGGEFRSWVSPGGPDDARYHQGPGQHDDVYILDVDGSRLVVDALYYDGSSSADRALLQQILDTIQIEPPA